MGNGNINVRSKVINYEIQNVEVKVFQPEVLTELLKNSKNNSRSRWSSTKSCR